MAPAGVPGAAAIIAAMAASLIFLIGQEVAGLEGF
jgi:hypothetical protein